MFRLSPSPRFLLLWNPSLDASETRWPPVLCYCKQMSVYKGRTETLHRHSPDSLNTVVSNLGHKLTVASSDGKEHSAGAAWWTLIFECSGEAQLISKTKNSKHL